MKKYVKVVLASLRGEEYDYTSGDINKALILLGIPMILEMVMEALFAVTDIFFVAKLGKEAVATIGLTESIIMLIESIAIGLSMAATAVVARRIGEGHPLEASNVAFQSIVLTIIIALGLGIPGYFFAEDILRLMGADEAIISQGLGYTKIMFSWNATLMLLFMFNAIFRGAGDAAIAMKSLWLANGINIVLDPCLIFGLGPFPELGIEGAAIATNIGRGTGVLFQLIIILGGSSIIKFIGSTFFLSAKTIINLLRIGAGGAGQFLISTASWIFLVRIVAIFGSAAIAGYTIAFRVIVFSILPSWGLANATATLVGQNLGAKKPDRAETSVWRAANYNAVFLVLVACVFFIFARDIVSIFDQNPEVIHHGTVALKIICFGYLAFSYGMIISQAFNGAGDTRTPTLINLFVFWPIQIPLAYYLSQPCGLEDNGVYIASAISMSLWALIAVLLFRKGSWKDVQV